MEANYIGLCSIVWGMLCTYQAIIYDMHLMIYTFFTSEHASIQYGHIRQIALHNYG